MNAGVTDDSIAIRNRAVQCLVVMGYCFKDPVTGRLGTVTSTSTASAQAAAVAMRLRAGQALDQVRREELRNLTDAEALAATEDLLDLLRFLPPRQGKSGLVEQQRIFARARA